LNEKFFRKKLYRISKHTLHVQKCSTKNQAICEKVKKYATARQAIHNKNMHFAYWITKATDMTSIYVILLLFHGNNGYTNTPQCYMYAACLVSFQFLQIFPVKVQKPVIWPSVTKLSTPEQEGSKPMYTGIYCTYPCRKQPTSTTFYFLVNTYTHNIFHMINKENILSHIWVNLILDECVSCNNLPLHWQGFM